MRTATWKSVQSRILMVSFAVLIFFLLFFFFFKMPCHYLLFYCWAGATLKCSSVVCKICKLIVVTKRHVRKSHIGNIVRSPLTFVGKYTIFRRKPSELLFHKNKLKNSLSSFFSSFANIFKLQCERPHGQAGRLFHNSTIMMAYRIEFINVK